MTDEEWVNKKFTELSIEMAAMDITDEGISKMFMYAFHQTMNEIIYRKCKIKDLDKRWMKNARKIVDALKEGELEIDGKDIFDE